MLADAPAVVAGFAALEIARGLINSLDVGGFLTQDQLILAHKNEAVLPIDKVPGIIREAIGGSEKQAGRLQRRTNSYSAEINIGGDMARRTSRHTALKERQGWI